MKEIRAGIDTLLLVSGSTSHIFRVVASTQVALFEVRNCNQLGAIIANEDLERMEKLGAQAILELRDVI